MLNSFAKPVAKVYKTVDKFGEIAKALEELKNRDILVGIPQEKASRRGEGLTNAELGFLLSEGVRAEPMRREMAEAQKQGATYSQARDAYLMEHGDPMWHIPPRPFLQPSIEANIDKLTSQQTKIVKAALDGKPAAAKIEMQKLGLLAQSIVKGWFTDPRNGWAPNAPATIQAKGSDRPNIDSGQMRNSITYVVRDKNAHD